MHIRKHADEGAEWLLISLPQGHKQVTMEEEEETSTASAPNSRSTATESRRSPDQSGWKSAAEVCCSERRSIGLLGIDQVPWNPVSFASDAGGKQAEEDAKEQKALHPSANREPIPSAMI